LPYTYYSLPYAGKNEEPNNFYMTGSDNYTKYLVEGLGMHVNLSAWNISMDRYFTIIPIA